MPRLFSHETTKLARRGEGGYRGGAAFFLVLLLCGYIISSMAFLVFVWPCISFVDTQLSQLTAAKATYEYYCRLQIGQAFVSFRLVYHVILFKSAVFLYGYSVLLCTRTYRRNPYVPRTDMSVQSIYSVQILPSRSPYSAAMFQTL